LAEVVCLRGTSVAADVEGMSGKPGAGFADGLSGDGVARFGDRLDDFAFGGPGLRFRLLGFLGLHGFRRGT
jgi:hypothetical protein